MNVRNMEQIVKAVINNPQIMIELYHTEIGGRFRVMGYIDVKIDGEWVTHIQLKNQESETSHALLPTEFGNFREITF